MEPRKLSVSARAESGKSPAQRLRREGRIPAVAYGKAMGVRPIAVSPKELRAVLASDFGMNTVIELELAGESSLTVLCTDSQHHPVTRELLHADFLQIHMDQPVDVDVPFELTGKAEGIVQGGTLRQVFRALPVRCLPTHIPVKISHDITALGLDQSLSAGEIKLPEGVSVRLPEAQTVAAIVTEKVRKEEEVAAAPGAAGAAPAAAPAADKKADAKKSDKK